MGKLENNLHILKKQHVLLTEVPIDWKQMHPLLLAFETCVQSVPLKGRDSYRFLNLTPSNMLFCITDI